MSRRALVLPISALIIAALCAYKLSRSEEEAASEQPIVLIRQAPFFELYDQRKPPQLVRLKSYLGRHRIVLVFFDERGGLYDPALEWLRKHAETLRRQDVKVFAISPALPQTHRKMLESLEADEPAPFQMLSDLDGSVHGQYGLSIDKSNQLATGVFLIDRAGNLPGNRKHPLPLKDPPGDLSREFGLE
jgi:peroxiredoxin